MKQVSGFFVILGEFQDLSASQDLSPQRVNVMVTLITACCLYLLLIGRLVSLQLLSWLVEVECHKSQVKRYKTFFKFVPDEDIIIYME
jgi:hypothetical protein